MNKQIKDFTAFVKKNRVVIYVLLGTILMLQICSRGALPPKHTSDPQAMDITISNDESDTPQVTPPEEHTPKPQTDFTSILLMAVVILGFFVAQRYGWLDKLFPKIVIFKVDYAQQKATGHLILKVLLINRTRESISFNNPTLAFFKGKHKREFIIKNIGGQNYFPITLTPGTGHKFNIDAQKFYTSIPDLEKYKTLQMIITTTTGRSYKSMKWPVWLTFRRI